MRKIKPDFDMNNNAPNKDFIDTRKQPLKVSYDAPWRGQRNNEKTWISNVFINGEMVAAIYGKTKLACKDNIKLIISHLIK